MIESSRKNQSKNQGLSIYKKKMVVITTTNLQTL